MGLYPALVVLGIYDRCTPKLASDASRAVAMLSSLAEAQAQLRSEGIALDIKTLRSTAYRYAARARAAQQSAACGLLDRVTGKRVVVSLDGGRVRVRRKKRGPKKGTDNIRVEIHAKDTDGNYLAVCLPRGAAENGPRLGAGGNFISITVLTAQPEPSGGHEAVEGGAGDAGDLGDGGLGHAQLEEVTDFILLAVEP